MRTCREFIRCNLSLSPHCVLTEALRNPLVYRPRMTAQVLPSKLGPLISPGNREGQGPEIKWGWGLLHRGANS